MGYPHGLDCFRHITEQNAFRQIQTRRSLDPLFQAKHLKMASAPEPPSAVRRTASSYSPGSSLKEKEKADVSDPAVFLTKDEEQNTISSGKYDLYRPYILGATAFVILGWWISATVLEATRHRWYFSNASWS